MMKMNLDNLDNYDIRQFCHFNYLYVPFDETKLKPYVKSLRLSQDQKKELQTLIHWNRNSTIMVYSFLSLANLVFIKVYFDFLIYLEMPMFYSILAIYATMLLVIELLILRYRSMITYWNKKEKKFNPIRYFDLLDNIMAFQCVMKLFFII